MTAALYEMNVDGTAGSAVTEEHAYRVSEGAITYTESDIPQGNYIAIFALKNAKTAISSRSAATTVLGTWREYVNIAAGCESTAVSTVLSVELFTITYNLNNDAVDVHTSGAGSYSHYADYTFPMPIDRAGDYAFTGWNTEADGSGDNHTSTTDLSGDLTLYAQWAASTNYDLKTGADINTLFTTTLAASSATAFEKSETAPESPVYYLDTAETSVPVWYDSASKTIYYYVPEHGKLRLNANSAGMFSDMSSLVSIKTSDFNTSNVTDMNAMFSGCIELTELDVSGFDTSNVTNMMAMFDGCKKLPTVDVSNWETTRNSVC